MSCVFPSLFPQTEALPLQEGTPCDGAHVMLFLTDLVFNSEEGHQIHVPYVATTLGPKSF